MDEESFKYRRILVITDNEILLEKFRAIETKLGLPFKLNYRYSRANKAFQSRFAGLSDFLPIDIKKEWQSVASSFDLILSLHCKQLFPANLVRAVKCINIHPGLNPYNRGWYPQVFSIINKRPLGATIHEIDEELDHGAIIDQEEVALFPWDTSLSAYDRVIEAEVRLVQKNLPKILCGDYIAQKPAKEGNINFKSDFNKLCELDLNETVMAGELIDRLRALSHGEFRNAYFRTDGGRRIFIKIELQPEIETSASVQQSSREPTI